MKKQFLWRKNFGTSNRPRMVWLLFLVAILMVLYLYWQPYITQRVTQRAVSILKRVIPDIFLYNDKDFVWNGDTKSTLVWGFTNKHSIEPGNSFSLMLSTDFEDRTVTGHIEIYRIGFTGSDNRQLVWKSQGLTVKRHEVSATANAIGPLWPAYINTVPTKDWLTGYYTFDFVTTKGRRNNNIAHIVVTPSDISGDVLVKLSTNTYQAYNSWGGSSLYRNELTDKWGHVVSFDRPTPSSFFQYEYFLVAWLEELSQQQGFSVHYATDFDIHRDKRFTTNYKLVISAGHDEYWSKEEFDHFYERIYRQGGNTLFLGANAAYWQVRYADVNIVDGSEKFGRLLICYKDVNDPIIHYFTGDPTLFVTAKFRDNHRRPETMLMGVGYESYYKNPDNRFPYYVSTTQKDFPFFKNTGYKKGEYVGDLIGYEWDNTDPEDDGSRLWNAEESQIPLLPRTSLHVLFSGDVVNWEGEKSIAEAVYFKTKAGAKVFSSGSILWVWGLGKLGYEQKAFKQFNKNLILGFLDLEY